MWDREGYGKEFGFGQWVGPLFCFLAESDMSGCMFRILPLVAAPGEQG